jgi:hypothetical protein
MAGAVITAGYALAFTAAGIVQTRRRSRWCPWLGLSMIMGQSGRIWPKRPMIMVGVRNV